MPASLTSNCPLRHQHGAGDTDEALAEFAGTTDKERHVGSSFYVRHWEGAGWLRGRSSPTVGPIRLSSPADFAMAYAVSRRVVGRDGGEFAVGGDGGVVEPEHDDRRVHTGDGRPGGDAVAVHRAGDRRRVAHEVPVGRLHDAAVIA